VANRFDKTASRFGGIVGVLARDPSPESTPVGPKILLAQDERVAKAAQQRAA
jgi:hypothetical protein